MADILSSNPTVRLLAAQWVAPMDGPIIEDGAVAISEGKIVSVGPLRSVRSDFPQVAVTDLGSSVVLPGLVNPHVHLELSHLHPGPPPAQFVEWLLRLTPRMPQAPQELQTTVETAVLAGVRQCLALGVTTVGDISRYPSISRPILKNSPLRAVSFGEVLAMAQRRHFLNERLSAAVDTSTQNTKLQTGVSPHAPYSVEADGYRQCLQVAQENRFPLATHLAESPDEREFLADHTGPFRDLWNMLGAWDNAVPRFAGGPIQFAQSLGLLDYPSVLAHVNYCDDQELAILAAGSASVVYCPRTHAYFGHPPHRWRDMLAAGINVAVGTDSTASSPDLNLVDDLRLLHRIAPNVPVDLLWNMATTRAARALMQPHVGSLTPGKAAELISFPTSTRDPLAEILQRDVAPQNVWINGQPSFPFP